MVLPLDNQKKKRRIYPWIILALFAVVLIVMLYLLFTPRDLTRFIPRIEAAIEERVTGDVELGTIVVKALPSPDIEITDASISHGGEKIFSTERLRARLELLPLLTGKTIFERLELASPDLVLKRGRDGELNITKFLESQRQKPEEEKEKKEEEKREERPEEKKKERELYVKTLDLRGGHARFIDELPPGGAAFEIKDLNAMMEKTPAGYSFGSEGMLLPSTPLAFSGKVNGMGEITGRGSIDGLALSRFDPYIRMKSPGASIEGRMDLDLDYEYDGKDVISSLISYRGLEASFPSILARNIQSPSGQAKISVSKGASTDVYAEDIKLNVEGFTLTGSFSMSGPEKERSIRLLASTTPVPLSTIKEFVPRKIPKKTAEIIKGIEPQSGSLTISNLRVEGKVDELKGGAIIKRPGGVELSAVVKDAAFRLKGAKEPFRDVSGSVSFKDNRLDVSGVTGRFGKKKSIERIDGWMKDVSGKAPFELRLAGSLDVDETLGIATEFAKGGLKERLSKAKAQGTVDFKAAVSGSLKGKEPYRYSGEAALTEGVFSYDGVPLSLDYVDARATFDQDMVRVIESNASSGQSKTSVAGTVKGYRGKEPAFDIDAKGSITGETLQALAKKTSEEVEIEGAIPFTLSAAGTPGSFTAKAGIDATRPRVFYEDAIDKKAGFPLKLNAEVRRQGSETIIRNARLDFGASSISAGGRLRNGMKAYSLSVISEQILIADLDEVSPFLNKEYASSGAVSLNVKTDKGSPDAQASYEGQIGVRDGKFSTKLLPAPVENVNLRAEFGGNRGSLVIDNLSTGTTAMNGRVDVLDMSKRTISFDLNFPALHSADLFKKEKKDEEDKDEKEEKEEKAKQKDREKTPKINGSGTIKAAEGDLWGHPFTAFETGVILDDRMVQLYPLSVNIDRGSANGGFTYFLEEAEPTLFTVDLKVSGIDIQTMLDAFGSKRRTLSGDIRAEILLSATRDMEPLARGMNGFISLSTGKGRLWKFGFISNIFSIVNIISIDELFESGLQHKGIDAHFYMIDGVLRTDDMVFDSDTLRMSAVGEIDTAASTIDATIALHPFVTIDRIITNIPLAGWIITGEEESTVSLYFAVEGPLKSPNVRPRPVASVTENILGIMQRLLRAPFKIFE